MLFLLNKKNGMKLMAMCLGIFSMSIDANTNTLIQSEMTHAHHIEKTQQQNVLAFQTISRQRVERYRTGMHEHVIPTQMDQTQQHKRIPEALVFVSLGLPKPVLIQTLQAAQTFHIPVVIRGLIDHSFRKTMSRLFNLVKNQPGKNLSGVLIDPLWFRQFHITTVPAVVVSHPTLCHSQNDCAVPFDVVRGNLPLQRALEIIATQGNAAADVARHLLKVYGHA